MSRRTRVSAEDAPERKNVIVRKNGITLISHGADDGSVSESDIAMCKKFQEIHGGEIIVQVRKLASLIREELIK